MKRTCYAPRGMSALAIALWVLSMTGPVHAQHYANSYQAYQPQKAYQPYQVHQPRGVYQSQQPHQAVSPPYSEYQQTYGRGQQFMPAPQSHSQQYIQSTSMARPQYIAMSRQAPTLPSPPVQMDTVPPGPMQQGTRDYTPQQSGMSYSQDGVNPTQDGYETYPSGNFANGNYDTGAGYSCDGYGCYNTPPAYGCYDQCGPRRRWFGGVYGLLMDRVSCDQIPLAFYTPTPPPGYYPTEDEIVFTTAALEHDVQGGAEVRFGATFACCSGSGYGCCDPCSGGGCGTLGWEVGYWGLPEDSSYARYDDAAAGRTYGMKSYQGLEWDYNGVWRPVNHAYDYAPPTEDHFTNWGNVDIRVNSLEVSRSYSVQNLEWNLVCLPLAGGGCAPLCDPCSGCYDSRGCTAGYGVGSGNGHFGGGCGAYCYTGPRCQCTTSLGVRYFRFDEDLWLRSNYTAWQMPADTQIGSGYLTHYVSTDNHLVGFQVGGNGCYHLGCAGRVALHFSSNAGIYGNYMEKSEYFSGTVRFANGDQDIYRVMSEDDTVAVLGELRLGASYQCSCHCRVYGGYRALGVTGVALTTNQLTSPYITPMQSGYIDCNGSLFLHGLQSGVEFMY